MKRQLTYDVAEKPAFDNDFDIKSTIAFLLKAEQTVKLYNKHQKALKDYMVKNNKVDLVVEDYHAHISEGTARMSLNQELLAEYLETVDKTVDDFKTLGNPPKSLELYRD